MHVIRHEELQGLVDKTYAWHEGEAGMEEWQVDSVHRVCEVRIGIGACLARVRCGVWGVEGGGWGVGSDHCRQRVRVAT